MNIIVGKTSGFCFGVRRAVNGCLEVSNNEEEVYCLGELVHNNEVINKLKENNVRVVDNIDEVNENDVTLVLRAHGVEKSVYEKAKEKNLKVIDFTCPFVSKIHDIVSDYSKKGFYVFLVGNKNHPEIIGTSSYCDNYFIIEEESDIENAVNGLLKSKCNDLLVVSQTTFSKMKFKSIVNSIKSRLVSKINIIIKDTICLSTEERQKETEELSKKVDLMIIIGGKNSSNTNKLYEIAKEYTDAILVETKDEIDIEDLKKYNNIGIMAGASTPEVSINEVIEELKTIG